MHAEVVVKRWDDDDDPLTFDMVEYKVNYMADLFNLIEHKPTPQHRRAAHEGIAPYDEMFGLWAASDQACVQLWELLDIDRIIVAYNEDND